MVEGKERRGAWSGQLAFVLAAAASAVGLGNIWRFPYLAAKFGGGIFLLVYIALAVTVGFAMMTAEVSIGRRTGLSPTRAYRRFGRKWSSLGWLGFVVPALILPYYCAIGGWIVKYLCHYTLALSGANIGDAAAKGFFQNFIGAPLEPLWYAWFFVFLCAALILLGIKNGIEKSNLVMMPLLLALSVAISAVSLFQPGAIDGLVYYLKPDFSRFSYKTVVNAMGQMFYSLSLAMGIMVTYGSYMRKSDSIERCVRRIEIFDTAVAFLGGLMIIPAVYALSDPSDPSHGMNAGPGLMFMTLPGVFAKMGGTNIVGFIFFLLVLFAALTSAISIYETVVSSIQDRVRCTRTTAALWTMLYALLFAVPSALCYNSGPFAREIVHGMPFLDFCDFLANNILMPILALCTALLIGWIAGPQWVEKEVVRNGETFRARRLFRLGIRYLAPGTIIVIFVSYLLDALGIVRVTQ